MKGEGIVIARPLDLVREVEQFLREERRKLECERLGAGRVEA